MKPIPILHVGDILELKKPHPCGGTRFRIMRVGGDVRVICIGCGRDMTINRVKLEHSIKKIYPVEVEESEDTNRT